MFTGGGAGAPSFAGAAGRFWPKVEIREKDACWPWKGATNPKGYGNFWLTPYRFVNAHRAAYILVYGEPEPGLTVRGYSNRFEACAEIPLAGIL